MLRLENTHTGKGVTGILHLFVGLMLADGEMRPEEIEKVKILIYKFKTKLPGDFDLYRESLEIMLHDNDYQGWSANDHLIKGLDLFDAYFGAGIPHDDHMEAIMDILTLVGEVGEMNEQEEVFISRVSDHFKNKYKYVHEG
jgi:hypothetical protein